MPLLTNIGLQVDASFPAAQYEAVHLRIAANHNNNPSTPDFREAWNALGYRYYEAQETADQFEQHFNAHGEGPPPLERYQQERLLFDFFSSAVSSLDAFYYGVYALASIAYPSNFPLATEANRRRVNPTNVIADLALHLPGDPAIAPLQAEYAGNRYVELRTARNVLTHRAAPGRRFQMEIGSPGPNPLQLGILPARLWLHRCCRQRLRISPPYTRHSCPLRKPLSSRTAKAPRDR